MKKWNILLICLLTWSCVSKKSPNTNNQKPTSKKQAKSEEQADRAASEIQGQETKNGDWSFADRGREKLKLSLDHLLVDAQRLPEDGLNMTGPGIESDSFINQKQEFLNSLTKFISLIQFPYNKSIYELNLTDDYFMYKDQKAWPQLRYFLEFGMHELELDAPISIHKIKQHILEVYFNSNNFQDPAILTKRFLELVKIESGLKGECSLEIVSEDQVEFSEIIKRSNIITQYFFNDHMLENFEKGLFKKGEVLYGINKDKITYKEHLGCTQGGTITDQVRYDNIGSVSTVHQTIDGKNNIPYIFGVNLWLKEIDGVNRLIFGIDIPEKYHTSTYLPLSAEEYSNINNFNSKNLQKQFFDKGNIVLNEAKNNILEKLKNITNDSIVKIIHEINDQINISKPEESLERLKQALINLENLTYDEYTDRDFNIKNFNFHEDLSDIFVTKSFYVNFGSSNSIVKTSQGRVETENLIMHEIGHLYGLNDKESLEFSKKVLDQVYTDKSGENLSQLIKPSEEQLEFSKIKKTHMEKLDKMIQYQHSALLNVLKNNGFETISSKEVNYTKAGIYCGVQEVHMYKCQRDFDRISFMHDIIYSYQHNGKTLRIKADTVSHIEISELSKYQYEIDSIYVFYLRDTWNDGGGNGEDAYFIDIYDENGAVVKTITAPAGGEIANSAIYLWREFPFDNNIIQRVTIK